jgi:hypothetical protein
MIVSSLGGLSGARAEITITKAPTARIKFSFLTGLETCRGQIRVSCLQDRNIVLVIDDDLGVLKGLQRLLWVHATATFWRRPTTIWRHPTIILSSKYLQSGLQADSLEQSSAFA